MKKRNRRIGCIRRLLISLALCLMLSVQCIAPSIAYAAEVTNYNTSYEAGNNFSISVEGTDLVISQIPDSMKDRYLWFQIFSVDTWNVVTEANVYGGELPIKIPLYITDGDFRLYLYHGEQLYGNYRSYWAEDGAPVIHKSEDGLSIKLPLGYEQMVIYQEKCLTYDEILTFFLESSFWVDSKDEEIKKKAVEITSACATDYEKVMAVHDWLAQNLYYDNDFIAGKSDTVVDAIEVLKQKRTVCQGYADLGAALLRAAGIPAKVVTGYGGTPITDSILEEKVINHAWNEAYVDGRWLIFDATWDSGNRYENGTFIQGSYDHMFFDPTPEVFSAAHIVLLNNDDTAISYLINSNIEDYMQKSITIYAGGTENKSVMYEIKGLEKVPEYISYQISYKSSDPSIATVSKNGTIYAKKKGNCTIYAYITTEGTSHTVYQPITVKNPTIAFTAKTAALSKGKTFQCKAKSYGLMESMVFTSSNTKVAAIDKKSGMIKAVGKGKTVITVSCKNKKASFTLTVK